TGRVTGKHVDQHPLGDAGRSGVADVIGAELPAAELPERHVVPQDLELVAVGVGDDVQGDVRVGRLDAVRHLDVGQLAAADDLLLVIDCQGVPRLHVVQVL